MTCKVAQIIAGQLWLLTNHKSRHHKSRLSAAEEATMFRHGHSRLSPPYPASGRLSPIR